MKSRAERRRLIKGILNVSLNKRGYATWRVFRKYHGLKRKLSLTERMNLFTNYLQGFSTAGNVKKEA